MHTDPFAIKHLPKWHPKRLAFKSHTLRIEWESRRRYDRYALPVKVLADLPALPDDIAWQNTSVTPLQMQHLLHALAMTETQAAPLAGTVVVEVGSFRGETTRCLARGTSATIVAVDPYGGYGGAEAEYAHFRGRTAGLENVVLERTTSGAAARRWRHGPAGLLFIDAVHDYVNTSFDIATWSPLLVPGGILALHDTDQEVFAGTRRAAFEAHVGARFELLAHPSNLTLFVAR
jgi:predicted O-methyltransferase YrrM